MLVFVLVLPPHGVTNIDLHPLIAAAGGLCVLHQEWQYAKVRQDAQLERIEKGVSTLGDMARGMQEELDKQNPVIDDIDSQINKVTGQLKSNNARLTGLVTQVRVPCSGCCSSVYAPIPWWLSIKQHVVIKTSHQQLRLTQCIITAAAPHVASDP